MSDHDKIVKISFNAEEFNYIFDCQLVDAVQFKKLLIIKNELLAKRPKFKRVNISLNSGDINCLLENVTREVNKDNNSSNNQNLLESIWGKLANQYNKSIHE